MCNLSTFFAIRFLPVLLLGLLICGKATADDVSLISRLAPSLNPQAVSQAVSAMKCVQDNGVGKTANRLAIIDYTIPSREPRLWVLDLENHKLLYKEHVAHGQGSGDDIPNIFSDREGSHQTSLGLFLTDTTYEGGNGYTMKLHGLSRGFNESAMRRLIVMHGAPYVDPIKAMKQGRLGRSWGCPAVRSAIAKPLIDTLKQGQFIFAYGPGTATLAACKSTKLSLADISTTNEYL
jgi:hypothetical protein